MSDAILYNALEGVAHKTPLGKIVTLTGTPSNGKFQALDGSSLLRSEYPELDVAFPSPPEIHDIYIRLPNIPNKYIQVKS